MFCAALCVPVFAPAYADESCDNFSLEDYENAEDPGSIGAPHYEKSITLGFMWEVHKQLWDDGLYPFLGCLRGEYKDEDHKEFCFEDHFYNNQMNMVESSILYELMQMAKTEKILAQTAYIIKCRKEQLMKEYDKYEKLHLERIKEHKALEGNSAETPPRP
jgi:hypothetical protein